MELRNLSYAVVGASNNPEKYGFRVVAALKRISSTVFPVNLKENEILGLKVYKTVAEIKKKLDIVVFVVPPEVSFEVLKGIHGKNNSVKSKNVGKKGKMPYLWFQPGSFDGKVTAYCKENNLDFSAGECIIIESEKLL